MIRVETITELVDTGLLLARQPLPGGPRVAIVGNSESLGLLTYDACLSEGLRPSPPVDLTTAATAADFHRALSGALADDSCDAVVVTAIPAVGEGRPRTRRWRRRCAPPRRRFPGSRSWWCTWSSAGWPKRCPPR